MKAGDVLSGEAAFTLHDTYGFPLEVTQEICADEGITVDTDAFARCMEQQKERARAATQDDAEAAWSTYDGTMSGILEEVGATVFEGYDKNECDATVVALLADGARVDALSAGDEGAIVLDRTVFYAEMGGQIGDTGTIEGEGFRARVTDTKSPEKGLTVHYVAVEEGTVTVGVAAHAAIEVLRRERIRRNHSATHILHWALRTVLGDHVKQAGSYVAPDRLRFDFAHFEAVSREQLDEVERIANEKIMEAHPVTTYETSLDEAREQGVTALFGEKYGDVVRVVDMDGFSRELCGGTHVRNTAEIGLVKIESEQSVGSNLRRIEAVTSFDALAFLNAEEAELRTLADALGVKPLQAAGRAISDAEKLKQMETEAKRAKEAAAAGDFKKIAQESVATSAAGYPVVIARVDNVPANVLRNAWDVVRSQCGDGSACVLAGSNNDKPLLLAAGTDAAVAAGFNAGAIIKAIAPAIQGGGGGKPTMAQAGGKNAAGIDDALAKAREILL